MTGGLPGVEVFLVAGLAVFIGALVQGGLGFGMGLIAAPVLAIADPGLVPVTMLLVTVVLPLLTVVREFTYVDWPEVGWALLGRLPGTGLGLAIVLLASVRVISIAVAIAVLLGVAASLVRWHPEPNPRALLVAGFCSAAIGTATSIGAPPMALLYQNQSGPRVRATLGVFLFVGVTMSLTGLAIAGQVHREDLITAAVLMVPMVVGFVASGPARRLVDSGGIRVAVLVLVTASSLVLLVRALTT